MAHAVFTNNARTTLSGSLTNVATSASVVDGSVFPAPTGGDYAYLTIEEGVLVEIVKLTARSTNTLTITRAQDGTTAQAFTAAAAVSLRLPRVVLDEFQAAIDAKLNSSAVSAFGGTLIDDVDASTARTTLGLGTAAVVNTGTSGATIPLLNGTNTFGGGQIFLGEINLDSNGFARVNYKDGGTSIWSVGLRTDNDANYYIFQESGAGSVVVSGSGFTFNGNTVWHAGNDGAGSGLDADTVDGAHVGTSGATIPLLNAANTWSAQQTFSPGDTETIFNRSTDTPFTIQLKSAGTTRGYIGMDSTNFQVWDASLSRNLTFNLSTGVLSVTSNTVWHAGNDGAGSGLDADTVDGVQLTGLVQQNLYGSFQSSFTSNINANTNRNVGAYGSYASSATNTPTVSGVLLNFTSGSDGSGDGTQFWQDYNSNNLYHRQRWGGTWGAWGQIWTAGNDGAGSGLDADTLDGVQGSAFALLATDNTFDRNLTFSAYRNITLPTGNAFGRIQARYNTDGAFADHFIIGTNFLRNASGTGGTIDNASLGTAEIEIFSRNPGVGAINLRAGAANTAPTTRVRINGSTGQTVEIDGRLNMTSAIGTLRSIIDWGYTQSGLTIWNNDNTPLSLGTSGVNRMTISATGDTSFLGNVNIDSPNTLSFGSGTRQMLNLWSTAYAIGVQSGTQYYRSGSRFSWFIGGVHSGTEDDPGAGGSRVMTLASTGIIVGTGVVQTDGTIRTRRNGNNIEFGHTNTAGYGSTLGSEVGTGAPFLAFNAEAGTTGNTYRTRGILGSGIRSNNAGGLTFFTLTNSNADNQSPTDRMTLLASGELTLTDVGPTSTVAAGYRGAPRNRQDSSYTLVLGDAGKSIVGYGSTASQTWTIPANSSVAYPIGTTITFVNMRSVACSIACTTDTMYLAGVGTTGTRTLASYGWATAVKVDTTNWLIGGTGLT